MASKTRFCKSKPLPKLPDPEPEPEPEMEPETGEDDGRGWCDSDFEDDQEVYENYEQDNTGNDQGSDDDDADYEDPEEPDSPQQPPVPPRGGKQAPFPTTPMCGLQQRAAVPSSRVSPVPPKMLKPETPPPEEEDFEDTYEAIVDPITPEEESYEAMDNIPLQTNTGGKVGNGRVVPAPPRTGLRPPPVPEFRRSTTEEDENNEDDLYTVPDSDPVKPPSQQPSPQPTRRAVPVPVPETKVPSPQPTRRAVPVPQPNVPSPQNTRRAVPVPVPEPKVPAVQRPSRPVPSIITPTEVRRRSSPVNEDLYEGSEMYMDTERDNPMPSFAGNQKATTKPLPRPPSDGSDDEFYTEVPDQKRNASPSRPPVPIPAVPQPRFTPPTRQIPAQPRYADKTTFAITKSSSGTDLTAKDANKRKSESPADKLPGVSSVRRAESDSTKSTFQKPPAGRVSDAGKPSTRNFEVGSKQPGKLNPGSLAIFNEKTEETKPDSGVSPSANSYPPAASSGKKVGIVNPVPTPPPPKKANTSEDRCQPTLPSHVKQKGFVPKLNETPSRNDNESNRRKSDSPVVETRSRELPKVPPVEEPMRDRRTEKGLKSCSWYMGTIERNIAEKKISDIGQDGVFIVRDSSAGSDSTNPYSLTVLFKGHKYNLRIRKRSDKKFALGSEKPDENVFTSVEELITFHVSNQIELIADPRKGSVSGKVTLKICQFK